MYRKGNIKEKEKKQKKHGIKEQGQSKRVTQRTIGPKKKPNNKINTLPQDGNIYSSFQAWT